VAFEPKMSGSGPVRFARKKEKTSSFPFFEFWPPGCAVLAHQCIRHPLIWKPNCPVASRSPPSWYIMPAAAVADSPLPPGNAGEAPQRGPFWGPTKVVRKMPRPPRGKRPDRSPSRFFGSLSLTSTGERFPTSPPALMNHARALKKSLLPPVERSNPNAAPRARPQRQCEPRACFWRAADGPGGPFVMRSPRLPWPCFEATALVSPV